MTITQSQEELREDAIRRLGKIATVADVNGYAPDLYPPDAAAQIFAKSAGRPYRPSNGFEGELFEGLWCARCKRDEAFRRAWDAGTLDADSCPILADVQATDTTDPDYPSQWQISTRGQPICTAFEPKDEGHPSPQTPAGGEG